MNREIVDKINESPYKVFFAIAGGGQTFIGDFTKISGASKTVIGAIVPYNQAIFDKFVKGAKPDFYVSADASRKLAVAAFNECVEAGVERDRALGISASCSIVKDNERLGRNHKFFISVHAWNYTKTLEIILNQGRTRENEEAIAQFYIFYALTEATLGIKLTRPPVDSFQEVFQGAPDHIFNLIEKNGPPISNFHGWDDDTMVIYSGSWNPLHEGHIGVKALSEKILGKPVILELTVKNPDKGQLDFIDIQKRISGLGPLRHIVTNFPTFRDKAFGLRQVFPKKKFIFVVGVDTWNRIWSERYNYNLTHLLENFYYGDWVKFLVFGRSGEAMDDFAESLRIKSSIAEKFTSPLSSTAIRKQRR